jgi:hypothetical protein
LREQLTGNRSQKQGDGGEALVQLRKFDGHNLKKGG